MIEDKQVIMNVDFHSQCWEAYSREGALYNDARIERLCEECAHNGVDTLFWRLSVCGKVAYHSKVCTVFDGEYRKASRGLKGVLEKLDPLAVACRCARKHGLRIYA